MTFYAHTRANQPDSHWEPLARHLSEVAGLAAHHAASFGAEPLGHAAGLLHDLGKYSAAFQARLRDPQRRADHSTAGALWARQNLPDRWGRLIAHVVAGHHAGLQDDLLAPDGRLAAKAGLLSEAARCAESDGLRIPSVLPGPAGLKRVQAHTGFQLAFLTRMIFSCLVDADRLAAAAFDEGGEPAQADAQPSIAALEQALTAFTQARAAPSNRLDELRAEVLHTAVSCAPEAPGCFTLSVPTGGGKTLTSLAFALAHARAHGMRRVIVVIPFTSVIEQTAAVFRAALGPLAGGVLEHHSAFDMEKEGAWAAERIGPDRLKLAMERWDSPIVVSTAVQFFESLFANRPSRCRKLHGIARSVIIVDEAQTIPLPLLRPCVAALKELARNYGCSVVLCTATQPALSTPGFTDGFDAPRELAGDDVPALFAALRRVRVRDIGTQDDAALAARMAGQDQALCIVNQRAHARVLFDAIRHLPGARHLSTCMHSVHRSRVLAEIRADLKEGRPCRVVSTSLIEAGVDVDFPLVLRASAGLDQIAQAAGRCNRESRRDRETSEVLVFNSDAHPVIRVLRPNAEVGAEMLSVHADDPLSPEAIRAFFELLYWRKSELALDSGRVLDACNERANDMNFPFATIADAMRFIDDAMVPVIVPAQEESAGEVEALVKALRFASHIGGIARKLGRYTVGVPRRVRSGMIAAGVAEVIDEARFGDQFVVLRNLSLYGTKTGLSWGDLTFYSAESLIVA